VAAIALELSKSSIRHIEDLWSKEKIEFLIHPEPQTINSNALEEIIFRSIQKYLERPGHVLLPDEMIPKSEFEKERYNSLLRVRKFWEYWHGSGRLDHRRCRTVSKISFSHLDSSLTKFKVHINIEKFEYPTSDDPTLPIPMAVNACFDRLEISINRPLLETMESHLKQRESSRETEVDTNFDCWIHGQVYRPEYNML
jgi:hypothetical protein